MSAPGASPRFMEESAPLLLRGMDASPQLSVLEDTPAYRTLVNANLLTTKYRKSSFDEIFEGKDLAANSSRSNDMWERLKYGWCVPGAGCVAYGCSHLEFFVPAGNVGLVMNEKQEYLFAQPGMHNITTFFMRMVGIEPVPMNRELRHGNRVILVVEQGYVGLAFDNGQPVLFPPGTHVWTSETLKFERSIPLDQHVLKLGPYTLLTVDEGYAAVTQNNGKQQILMGGHTWLLDHKNWRFEKFLTLKIQTDNLEQIQATSADNISMAVTSTVTWRVVDAHKAATMAAETMNTSDARMSSDINKLRGDVLKQAIASLAMFMGSVNYSDSFHVAAAAQRTAATASARPAKGEPESEQALGKKPENPLYDSDRMTSSVAHANETTKTYGVQILSINILSCILTDPKLTTALAAGAVASAQALQAETAARGNAKAMRIDAEAAAAKAKIEADGQAEAEIIKARAAGEAARLIADGNKKAADLIASSDVAVDLAKMDKSALMLGKNDKFFFGQEPAYMANLVLKGAGQPGAPSAGMGF